MNANSNTDEFLPPLEIAIEIIEEFGCASDCVARALSVVEPGMEHVDEETLMYIFNNERLLCLEHVCGITP